ncbi:acyltransferase family protein [Pantoea anthophila]|uniref:acyltransferase family protein n=1 Tax=Pantoea anthophila TaxID=470931 RepID=UPI0027841E53|nr:acyltransferase [Pantoea anthophila]MDQ1215014.1 exopolysaccharide production protein ExoZ [Pantoea anthophila]
MLYSIQFLRGIAALMVVLTHIAHKGKQYETGSLNWFHVGGNGVDLFFIISGFIMCVATHNKNITLLHFLLHRVIRIIPLYWVLSLVALFIFLVSPQMVNSSGGKTGIIQSFFLIPDGVKFLIQNGWTLSYEFYYYLIFSVFIFLTDIRLMRYLGVSLTILLLSVTGLFLQPETPILVFLFSNMLLEFMLGVLSFVIISNIKPGKVSACLMITLGLSWVIYNNVYGTPEVPFGKVVTSGLPMFLIFLGALSLEQWFATSKGCLVRVFEQLGNSSYSLYLIHPFILSPAALVLKNLGLLSSGLFTEVLLSASIISGLLTYHFIEKPLARLTQKWGKDRAAKKSRIQIVS